MLSISLLDFAHLLLVYWDGKQARYSESNETEYSFQDGLYDYVPGMELTPTNPVTLKPEANRSPIQVNIGFY